MKIAVASLAASLLLGTWSASAEAQTPTEPASSVTSDEVTLPAACESARRLEPGATIDTDRARELFVAAVEEVQDERWADAEAGFRQSFDLSGSPVAAFNLGLALRALNRHIEARDALCAAARDGALDPEIRAEAGRLAAAEDALTASLSVTELVPSSATLSVDGASIAVGPLPLELRVDAGRAVRIEAAADLHEPSVHELTLTAGEHRALAIALDPLPVTIRSDDSAVWIVVVSVAVAVAVGGTVLAWWAYEDAQLDPTYPTATIRF